MNNKITEQDNIIDEAVTAQLAAYTQAHALYRQHSGTPEMTRILAQLILDSQELQALKSAATFTKFDFADLSAGEFVLEQTIGLDDAEPFKLYAYSIGTKWNGYEIPFVRQNEFEFFVNYLREQGIPEEELPTLERAEKISLMTDDQRNAATPDAAAECVRYSVGGAWAWVRKMNLYSVRVQETAQRFYQVAASDELAAEEKVRRMGFDRNKSSVMNYRMEIVETETLEKYLREVPQ